MTVSDDVTATPNIVVTISPLDTSTAGLKTITYTAKDEANNTATVTRTVLVGDLTASTADAFYNLHFPAILTLNPAATESVFGQIYLKGATEGAGQAPNIQAWVGVNSANTDPSTWGSSAWKPASYNAGQTGNNDEYSASLSGADYTVGTTNYYATRWQVGTGAYAYGGTTGPWNGTTSSNGILTMVPVRNVTFAVDMGVQIFKGLFDPSTNGVEVRGDFNGFAGSPLIRQGTSSIYTNTFVVPGTNGTIQSYKFFGNGTNALTWEALANNRPLTLASSNQVLSTVFFGNDDGKPPVITLNGSNAITINLQDAFTDLGATALDEIDGTVPVAINNTVNTALAGTYTNTYTARDAAGNSSTNTRTVVVSSGTGVDTRPVTFAVDMSVENFKGRFDPSNNAVEVRGSFNNFAGSPLVRQGTSLIYTNTFPLVGSNGAVRTFKFFSTGTNAVGFESGADRTVTMASNGVTVNTGTNFFNGVSESRKITFRVDMSAQALLGNFNTNTGVVKLAGYFNSWQAAPMVAQGNGIYALEVAFDGPLNVSGVEYKFLNGDTFETVSTPTGNRTLSGTFPNLQATQLAPALFEDVQARNVTFAVDMTVQNTKGRFNPTLNGVEVRGSFNSFAGSPLIRQGTTRIYTNTFVIPGTNGTVHSYKFFGNGTNGLSWEVLAVPDRSLTLASSNQVLPLVYFNNDDATPPVITLNGSNAITINLQDAFTDPGATALDEIDGTVPVAINNTVNTALAGTYTNTYTARDAAGNSSTNTRTVVVSSGTGVDTRTVAFAVDMSVESFKGRFDPSNNAVEVRGSFNNFSGSTLVRQGTSLIYTNTFPLVGSNGAVRTFKFFSTGTNAIGFESGADRAVTMASNGVTVNTGTNFFNGVAESRKITFRVDMSAQALLGNFNTNTGTVCVAGTFNGWSTNATPLSPQSNGIYGAEVVVDGPLSAVEYKFVNGTSFETVGTANANSMGNRTIAKLVPNLTADTLDTVLFGDVQARSLTFKVDMGVQITKGLFAHTNPVEVRFGDFLAGGKTLTREGSTTIYSGTFPVAGNAGSPFEYKFWRTNAATNVTFERVDVPRTNDLANRTYTLGSNGVSATLSTAFFNNDDGIGPVITLKGANPLNLTNGAVFTDPGATAADAAEGTSVDITGTGTVDTSVANSYTVTYTATDANGNAATSVTRTVIVAAAGDTTPPVISLTGSNNVTVAWGSTYTDAGATATDNVDSSVTVNSSGTVNTSVPGTYTITYTASDVAGNLATAVTRTVTVDKPSSTPGADGLSPLLRLAYGGTNSNSVVARPSLALSGSNLTLTAIVRTNQSNLTVVGQWVTNVNQFTNTNVVNSNTITGTASANQTNVPAGCERRVFSVPQNTDTRKFLRLKVEMP